MFQQVCHRHHGLQPWMTREGNIFCWILPWALSQCHFSIPTLYILPTWWDENMGKVGKVCRLADNQYKRKKRRYKASDLLYGSCNCSNYKFTSFSKLTTCFSSFYNLSWLIIHTTNQFIFFSFGGKKSKRGFQSAEDSWEGRYHCSTSFFQPLSTSTEKTSEALLSVWEK